VTRTLYDVLGLEPDVDAVALRRAYLELAQRHHPDRPGGDADEMRDINAAWATLGDPVRRRQYDLTLTTPTGHGSAATNAPWTDADDPFAHERYDADLDDDTSFSRITMVVPRWLAMVPVSLFVLSIALFGLGVVMVAPPLLAGALMTFVLSVMLFLAAPFIALAVGRRANR
jgi:hypothetical protein